MATPQGLHPKGPRLSTIVIPFYVDQHGGVVRFNFGEVGDNGFSVGF